jgi:orotidine-5'-phosphate decarboxylase
MNAYEKIKSANFEEKYICIGLDTDPKKLPPHLASYKNPVAEFNKRIIEATKDSAAAYKLNLAFYESEGKSGIENIEETLSYIPQNILTIADGKRGDIGNTSNLYARAIFDSFKFDASTLNPFMGEDSLQPFLSYADKFNFILALTSNPGSANFQKLKMFSGELLYQEIIRKIHQWNRNLNCGLVFGATQLDELRDNLKLINDLPLLIPGVGAQGGSLSEITELLFQNQRYHFLVNVSRGIIQKSLGEDFAEAAKIELERMNIIVSKIKRSGSV